MNVADSNAFDNPDSIALLAQQLQHTIVQAAQKGDSLDKVERAVLQSVLQMGFQAIELFVSLQGNGDLGPQVQTGEGKTLQRSDKTLKTTVRSIFGEHRLLSIGRVEVQGRFR